MINFNNRFFSNLNSSKDTLYPGLSFSSRRLLGLREYKRLSRSEERKLFITPSRLQAYDAIKTNTNPRKYHMENKTGLVREVVKNGLINRSILKNEPTIYLGSGLDVEYPLALGSRNIYLVDPIYKEERVISDLQFKIQSLIRDDSLVRLENKLSFLFDFEEGGEEVTIYIVPCSYGSENINLPKNIGLVITYASQGSNGKVKIGKDIENNLIDGGYLLGENKLQKKVSGKKNVIKLGKK